MKLPLLFMLALALSLPADVSFAADDKAIQAERREAQKQRQLKKNERNNNNKQATQSFRERIRELKKDYQERARALDTEFQLQQIDIRASQEAKIAEAEATMQQQLTQLLFNPDRNNSEQALAQLKADMKSYSDQLFSIKKQAAQEQHDASMENELAKHSLMTERDEAALAMAQELGLRSKFAPILATPIGDGLTAQEQSWNEREQKEVARLYQNNQKLLGEFLYGQKLRLWEIANKREDFELEWQKKTELHALNQEQTYYNSLLMQASTGGEIDQQAFAKQMSELQKQNQLINIKYKTLHDKNRIQRREEKRDIMALK